MTRRGTDRLALCILAIYLVLALVCSVVVTPFENLDEIEHFGVVRYIVETGSLPVHGRPDARLYHYRQEASQPPLYYVLSSGLASLLGLRANDADSHLQRNPYVVCGTRAADNSANRAVLYHDPSQEAFPWRGTLLMLHLLRAWSVGLQAVTVAGTYALARLALPRRPWVGLLAMTLVATNPQFLLVASGVNNDNLVTPLATVALCFLLWLWQRGTTVARAIALGLLAGAAGLAKLSGWLVLALSTAVLGIRIVVLEANRRRAALLQLGLVPVSALGVGGWWFWRNWRLYGDPTGLGPMLELVGRRTGPILPLGEAWLVFRSFWGKIPCAYFPDRFYLLYIGLTIVSLGGLMWGLRRLAAAETASVLVLGGWILLVALAWLRWDAITPAPGGRLLFPAFPAAAVLMSLGTTSVMRGRLKAGYWVVIGLLIAWALWGTGAVLPRFFAAPPRRRDPGAVTPGRQVSASFGSEIELLGYDLQHDEDERILDVTLYWECKAPVADSYVLALQLVSPVPGNDTLRWNHSTWPGKGNYPTSAWQPGEVVVDRYRLGYRKADFPTQAWDLRAALYLQATGARLPVRLGGIDVGGSLFLDRLRVPGQQPRCPQGGALDTRVSFSGAIALTHVAVEPGAESVTVDLCWRSLEHVPADLTVFVHLVDSDGRLASTGDGPPMDGGFPTFMWTPGDAILDRHKIPVTAGSPVDGQQILVGLYDATAGTRLPATLDGLPVPEGAVLVWPDPP
jgi:hypothetical protein